MKRAELLKTLKLAAPALLSDNEAVLPILKCLRFTGTHVMASNDVIATCLAVPVTEKGIVPGKRLISFLSACSSKLAKFSMTKKGNLLVRCASTKLTLTLQPEDEWPFEFPDVEDARSLSVGEGFFTALELCSAQSPDTGLGGWAGGIIFSLGTKLNVFGIGRSRSTISQCRVDDALVGDKKESSIVVPSSFCKVAAATAKELGSEAVLHVSADSAVLDWGDGENVIATKLLDVDMPDVQGRWRAVLDGAAKRYVPISDAMAAALRRAAAVGRKGACVVTSEEAGLRLRASSGDGARLNDLVPYVKGQATPKVRVRVPADLVVLRLDACIEIAFGKEAVVMRSKDGTFTYLAAYRAESQSEAGE